MSYKEYRYSLAIGDFVDDIYVEVRNWKNIVAFIDAHDKNYPKPSLELRMPLLKRFSVIASSYYIEYKSIVSNELIPNHPEPLTEIVAYNTKGEKRFFNCNKLKEFIEGLGDSKLSLKVIPPINKNTYK
ncbi:hypothetical protein BTW00_08545 [Psychrobacter sp. C 20.9]|uniref:hypothetical protein n=1 Tax=Psychrobacter sp. C 20.9 TaxID=1926477 RepID=UPI000946B589|nr:hypothetical protein [Psychrobacter sp. C 20.9]OLF35574.1 hypothetical protein BTW00_08545 [Psychrobacter sp. C 20.9]